MKRLKNFRLLLISGLMLLVMGSCIKEPKFTAGFGWAYMNQLQSGNFMPYIYIEATENMASASLTLDGRSYQLENMYYGKQTTDASTNVSSTLPVGKYVLDVTGVSGNTDSDTLRLYVKEEQIMGELKVDSLYYSLKKGIIVGKWQTTANATGYRLAITPVYTSELGTETPIEPQTRFAYWNGSDNDKATSGEYRGDELVYGSKYRFAVTALNGENSSGTAFLIQRDRTRSITVIWGKE